MPANRSVNFCASGAIALALVMRSFAPTCPVAAGVVAEDKISADPTWGRVVNLTLSPREDGTQFDATDNSGRHRVLTTFKVPAAGRYRLSVETKYQSASSFELEISDAEQTVYARFDGDLKSGTIGETNGGMLANGVEPITGAPGRYRWWIDIELPAGHASAAFSLLNYENDNEFVGIPGSCQAVFSNASLVPGS